MNNVVKLTAGAACGLVMSACGGGGGGGECALWSGDPTDPNSYCFSWIYTVKPSVRGSGGTIDPSQPISVREGEKTSFTLTPNPGYSIASVDSTCGGTLSDSVFTTGHINDDCSVTAVFAITGSNN
jgi:hypothetical protein